jgi:putative hydrolase of the HAD superfamily
MSVQEWHEHLTRRFGVRLGFEEFCEAWNRALARETILEEKLFAELGGRYGLALLSNTDPIHVAHMEANFGFMRHFPAAARVYSCAVGARKPSPAIYAKGIAACGVPAREILYVDDVGEYIAAGRGCRGYSLWVRGS